MTAWGCTMPELIEALGIGIDEATQRLEDEGVEKFIKPFGSPMRTPAEARGEAVVEIAARTAKQVLRVHTVNRGTDEVPCVVA